MSGRCFVRTILDVFQDPPALDVLSGRHFVRTALNVLSGPHPVICLPFLLPFAPICSILLLFAHICSCLRPYRPTLDTLHLPLIAPSSVSFSTREGGHSQNLSFFFLIQKNLVQPDLAQTRLTFHT